MKKAYIIKTSEDGNIGIFSSKKRVFEAIEKLMNDGWETAKIYIDPENQPKPTYPKICKQLSSWGCTLYTDDDCTIEVQKFRVNQF